MAIMSEWVFANLTPLKYGVILADPAWKTVMRSNKGLAKSPEQHYATMSEAEISALPVGHLASRDCALILLCRWINIPEALRVMAAWGFQYKTGGSWQKRTVNGKKVMATGYIHRNSTEPFLIGTMGEPYTKSKSVRDSITSDFSDIENFPTDIDAIRREHSRKPQEMRDNVDLLFPHAYGCELFAREPWAGRDVWSGTGQENMFGAAA
jgi:N6-adenosine-specific RNA methylase IME4